MVLLSNMENLLHFWRLLRVWVVNLLRRQSLHLFLGDKAALVPVALLGKVLSAAIPDFFLVTPSLFLDQISENFGQFHLIDLARHILHARGGRRLAFDTDVGGNFLGAVHVLVTVLHLRQVEIGNLNLIDNGHIINIGRVRDQARTDGAGDGANTFHDLIG